MKHSLGILLMGGLFAQSTVVTQPGDSLVAQIVCNQQARELATEKVRFVGTARANAYHGRTYDPPLVVDVDLAMAEGRILVNTRGADLDHGGVGKDGNVPSSFQLSRLYLPNGMVETLDEKAKGITYAEFHYRDVRSFYSLIAPGELLWSFSSSVRSVTLARRNVVLEEVAGVAPCREAVIRAASADGTQVFRYRCVEAWDWLPRRVESLARSGNETVLTYSVDVESVHHTRLCTVPAHGRITDVRNGKVYHSVDLDFAAPTFADVCTPTTVNIAEQSDEGRVNADPLYGPQSFIAQNRLWDRGKLIDGLFASAGLAVGDFDAGTRNWVAAGRSWIIVAAITAALASWLVRRRSSRVSVVLVGISVLLSIAPLVNPWCRRADHHEPVMVQAADRALRSRSLCGIDALYGMARRAGAAEPSYLRFLRLVRPGHAGTDLATLQRVAESTDLPLHLVRASDYDVPPVPTIVHVSGDHFLLLTRVAGTDIELFDPGVGLLRQPWSSLRGRVSELMLARTGGTL